MKEHSSGGASRSSLATGEPCGHPLGMDRRGQVYDEKYEAIEEVGRGTFGEVWRGRDRALERDVAIKLMARRGADSEAEGRFLREARILASLEHPNIVPVYSFGRRDAELFFVMKFVEGSDLSYTRHCANLSPQAVIALLAPVAAALDYAHANDVVHRDLKPGNIRITPDGKPVVIDFGIAYASGAGRITRPNTMLGSPHYMSPEQTSGQPAGSGSDQYSLAVILFQLLTGRLPFNAETPMKVLYEHVNTPAPSARMWRPDLPEATAHAIMRGMAKAAEDRYSSCTELLRATGLLRTTGVESPAATGDFRPAQRPPLRLIVVEDELTDYLIVERQLESSDVGDFECRQVTRLGDLFLSLREPTDAILLDLGLPDSQGLRTVERVREMAGELPVVVQTSTDDESLARKAVQAGAQDYVVKGRTHARALARSLMFAVARHRLLEADDSDALTCKVSGLPNRVLLTDRLGVEIARTRRDGEALHVACLNLGAVSPRRLRRFAETLGEALLPWETAGHVGDRRIVLLLPGSEGSADARLGELLAAVEETLEDQPAVRSAVVEPEDDAESALRRIGAEA